MEQRTGRTGWTLAAMFWLLPAAALGGGMALAPLQGLAGLVAGTDVARAPRPALQRTALFAAPLLLFLVWASVTVLWSPAHRPEQALRIAAAAVTGVSLIAAAGLAAPRDRARAQWTLVAALAVLCVLCGIEAGFGLPINRLDEPNTDPGILERNPGKGVSILVALGWAGLAALLQRRRWLAALALGGAIAVLSAQFHMSTNEMGVAIGAGAFGLGLLAPRIAPVLVSGFVALWLLLAPWVSPLLLSAPFLDRLPFSWQMRAHIWAFAHDRIAEKPLTGWGLDSARTFGDTLLSIGAVKFRAIPLHPHSFSLHVWLDTGAVGAVLLAGAILAGGIAAARAFAAHRFAAAALTATVASLAAIWNVSYGAWQEWWMATAFLALAACAALKHEADGSRNG